MSYQIQCGTLDKNIINVDIHESCKCSIKENENPPISLKTWEYNLWNDISNKYLLLILKELQFIEYSHAETQANIQIFRS